MHFNILTIFPEMFPGTLAGGVVGRALERGIWSYDVINIRDFAINNYGGVDDTQFGGGAGMVMRPDVLGSALDSIKNPGKIIYFSPRGKTLNQKIVREFIADQDATYTLLCGRYEGIDERIIEEYDIMELSIGDYILSGGEIAAQVFVDSCVRVMDNVVHGGKDTTVPIGNANSVEKVFAQSGADYDFILFPNSGHILIFTPFSGTKYNVKLKEYCAKYFPG